MATIHKEILIDAPPEQVWDAVRDVAAVHRRLVPGLVVDTTLDGDVRTVTFANGSVVRERIVTIDDSARRFAYAATGGRATHHNSSLQVLNEADGRTRLVWITDVLPDDAAGPIGALVEQGAGIMRETLSRGTPSSSVARPPAVAVYTALLDAWNRRDANAFAALFAPDGHVTGFDGSQMIGPAEIASELGAIFAGHPTAAYVAKVRDVRALDSTVMLLHAVAGMIPPGASALNPATNAIQTLVLEAGESSSRPRIVHFQNTPAAFHGRPQLVDAMTDELTRVHEAGLVVAAG